MKNMIQTRAYELYRQRGEEHGRDFDDWLRAEKEIMKTNSAADPLNGGLKRTVKTRKRPSYSTKN